MKDIHKKDPGSLVVMVITLVLFIGAIFSKGFTHDLLLETGVFLVSVKLMIMAYKNSITAETMQKQLREIRDVLANRSDTSSDKDHQDKSN
jgi:hypothetical protein